MAVDQERRGFLRSAAGAALGVTAACGTGVSLYALSTTWKPLPSVIAAGTTTVDVSPMQEGDISQVEYRGKPVYILRKTAEMSVNEQRDVRVGQSVFTVVIAICTHLGCIPGWKPDKGHFLCACHGGIFDASGVQQSGPPPSPMVIPPFRIDGTNLVLGEEGPEYQQLTTG